jgi:2-oxoglutarate ferredoxin oxidoreductase subunit delta
MAKKVFVVEVDFEKCKACYLCIKVCKKGVFEVSKKTNKAGYSPAIVSNSAKCVACKDCCIMCPDSAIKISKIE